MAGAATAEALKLKVVAPVAAAAARGSEPPAPVVDGRGNGGAGLPADLVTEPAPADPAVAGEAPTPADPPTDPADVRRQHAGLRRPRRHAAAGSTAGSRPAGTGATAVRIRFGCRRSDDSQRRHAAP